MTLRSLRLQLISHWTRRGQRQPAGLSPRVPGAPRAWQWPRDEPPRALASPTHCVPRACPPAAAPWPLSFQSLLLANLPLKVHKTRKTLAMNVGSLIQMASRAWVCVSPGAAEGSAAARVPPGVCVCARACASVSKLTPKLDLVHLVPTKKGNQSSAALRPAFLGTFGFFLNT